MKNPGKVSLSAIVLIDSLTDPQIFVLLSVSFCVQAHESSYTD